MTRESWIFVRPPGLETPDGVVVGSLGIEEVVQRMTSGLTGAAVVCVERVDMDSKTSKFRAQPALNTFSSAHTCE